MWSVGFDLNQFLLYRIILFVSILCTEALSNDTHIPSALCFLSRQLIPETVKFAKELAQNGSFIDVYILINDNSISLPSVNSLVHYLQVNETICSNYGFRGASHPHQKTCSAWDKALGYFAQLNTHHQFVWFVETDVFIPSVRAFFALHELYSTSADLVGDTSGIDVDGTNRGWALWDTAVDAFFPPWYFSMASTVGCSRRLLSIISEHAAWRGQLPYIEILFQTTAGQNKDMIRVTPFELSTIKYRVFFTFEQIQVKPNNWWHPVKSFGVQKMWRER